MDGCGDVVRQVPEDRWDAPSPCEGWSARDVLGHLIGGIRWGAELVAGEDRPSPVSPPATGMEQPIAAWDSARLGLEDACTLEVLERRVRWPFGEHTVERGLGLFSLEVLIHTWDIASATGIDVTLDPDLIHDHFKRLERIGHMLRGPGMYGPEVLPPPNAAEQERLLAFLGRQV